ncbi:trafficking protein particle complex subunit 11 [Ceratobasidium sp. AG-Ba]|nr:trafficking protein particle complex subunit 11 [Ceratobasidium sp. AG-Ba]
MNGYPNELIAQHVPLMFVAGLDAPAANVPPPPTPAKLPTPVSSSRSRERMSIADLPSPSSHSDPFAVLIGRLRTALGSRKGTVWDAEPGRRFHVALVDRNVTLPPRKVQPAPSPGAQSTLPPRSPLSPLTPTSPLHPDGLIAPIWIRKHIELVPAVFVLFARLWEAPIPKSPLEPKPDTETGEERQRDTELATEIAARKRSTDDPSLDARLSFIRRQGGLDSRAALFVLSPVSSTELNEFVKSLQDALHESAMEYYVAHSKRVRRKRNRHNHGTISVVPQALGAGSGRPLGAQGWTVRYEYKMATFAEFRDEQEVARKHYEDCWTALVEMFGSTAILPPRTKRWAEAKVLADCITVKAQPPLPALSPISINIFIALLIYPEDGVLVTRRMNSGAGWRGKLLEHGLRNGLRIPSLAPPPIPHNSTPAVTTDPSNAASTLQLAPGQGVASSSGHNPSLALQHPGFYYYVAAGCSITDPSPVSATPAFANEKKIDHHSLIIELFTKAYETFKQQQTGQSRLTYYIAYRIAETHYESGKFDLAVKFFERIAKTYRTERWTKLLRPALALWYECARNLADIELSVRILLEMLVPGMTSQDERDNIGEDLMAILKSTAPSTGTTPITIDLSEHEPLFDISATFWDNESPVNQPVLFQIFIRGPSDGALSELEFALLDVKFSNIDQKVQVHHSTEKPNPDSNIQRAELGTIGGEEIDRHGWLRWGKDGVLVLQGSVTSSKSGEIKLESVTFHIREGDWRIELPMDQSKTVEGASSTLSWYDAKRFVSPPHKVELSIEHAAPTYIGEYFPILVTVRNADTMPLHISLDVMIQPALDDSQNDITIDKETSNSLIKQVSLGLVQPQDFVNKTLLLFTRGQPGDRVLDFSVRSSVLVSRAPSRAPSPLRSPILQTSDGLLSPASPNMKNKASLPGSADKDKAAHPESDGDTTETLHTLTIPAVLPFSTLLRTTYERPNQPQPGLLDVPTFEQDYEEVRNIAIVDVSFGMEGEWGVEVTGVGFELAPGSKHVMLNNTLGSNADLFPIEWAKGDSFTNTLRVQTHVDESAEDFVESIDEKLPLGNFKIHWRRAGTAETIPISTSIVTLPALQEPEDELVGLVHLPPFAVLHTPFPLHLTIENRTRSRTADVVLTLESTDQFVCSGPRNAHLTAVLPGTTADVHLTVVPLATGFVSLPRIRLQDRREDPPREIAVVAKGQDVRDPRGELRVVGTKGEDGRMSQASVREAMFVLVKPS